MNKLFSDIQSDILTGSMLGDGHLGLNRKNRSINARFIIRRALKDSAYLMWEYDIFKEFCSNNSIREYSDYHSKTKKSYPGVSFTTLSNPLFTERHSIWYNGIKRVPCDLKINQLIMLIWFLDDGCVIRTKSNKLEIKLSTDGFIKDDSLFLCELLQQRYNQKFNVYNSGNEKFHIRGFDLATKALINDIMPVFPFHLMNRKATWLFPLEKKNHSYDLKEEKIFNYIKNNSVFYSNDLGRYAEFTFQRKNNKIEVATSNLMRYLQPHIDDGLIIEMNKDKYHLGRKFSLTELGKTHFF